MTEEIIKIEIKHTGFPPDLNTSKINDIIREFVSQLQSENIQVTDYSRIETKMINPNK